MNPTLIISALKRRTASIVFIPVFCAFMLFFITGKSPKNYKSHAQIATGITESAEVSINENAKDNDQPYKIAQKFNNLMEMMRSRQSINLVQYKILLHELNSSTPFLHPQEVEKYISPTNKPKLIEQIQLRSDSMLTLNFVDKSDIDVQNLINFYGIGIEVMLKKISIKRLPESDYLYIEGETENPAYTAFIVNTLIEEFIRYYQVQKALKSAGSVDFFEKMARIKKKELDAKVNELKTFKLRNNVINLYEQTKSIVNQLSSIEIMREQENAKIPSFTKAIKDIEFKFSSKDKLFYESANSKLNNKIDELKANLVVINNAYYQNGMKDLALSDTMKILRGKIDILVQDAADEGMMNPNAVRTELVSRKLNAEIDLEIAIKTVKSIDNEIDRLQSIIKTFAPMEASIGAIEREISVASEVYLLVLNKLNAAQFASLYTGENIRQAEYALEAEKPESSKRMVVVVLTFAITLIIVVAGIIISKMMDHAIYTPDQLADIVGSENVISSLPLLDTGIVDFGQIFTQQSESIKKQFFVENSRQIRQHIVSNIDEHSRILCISANKNEGKTFSIITIAYSLTLIGKKVLVIDANLKSNQLSDLLKANTFLNDIAVNNASDAKCSINTHSVFPGLDVIGNRMNAGTPNEVFLNKISESDWDELKANYDYILIEAAETNKYADAKELANVVETMMVVKKAGNEFSKEDNVLFAYVTANMSKFKGYILTKEIIELNAKNKIQLIWERLTKSKKNQTVSDITIKF